MGAEKSAARGRVFPFTRAKGSLLGCRKARTASDPLKSIVAVIAAVIPLAGANCSRGVTDRIPTKAPPTPSWVTSFLINARLILLGASSDVKKSGAQIEAGLP